MAPGIFKDTGPSGEKQEKGRDRQGYGHLDKFSLDEGSLAVRQQRQGGMPVLNQGVGEKDRERDDSSGKEGDKDHMRSGLGHKTHQDGQKNHQEGVLADPCIQVDEV